MAFQKSGFYILAFLACSLPAHADAPAALTFNLAQQSPQQAMPLNSSPAMPSSSAKLLIQGTQISLNGQTLNGNWSQWQTNGTNRFALSDAVMPQLGVELLSTTDTARQAVQWFSEGVLPTRLAPPLRYLDITDWAQKNGWKIQTSGNLLQILTPPATLTGLQQEPQAENVDRLTIFFDRPIRWQADPQQNELVLTLDAQADPTQLLAFKPTPASRIRSLTVEALSSKRTQLKLGVPIGVRPRITTLSNPDRIVIDVGADFLSDKNILWADGLFWRQKSLAVRSNQFPVVWLEVNPRQPGLSIRPILPDSTTLIGTLPLLQTAQQSTATAAINGGYFNRNNQLPLGAIKINSRFASGAILNRGVVGWDAAGTWKFDRLTLQETLILGSGQRFPLTTLNSAYAQAGIARYTADWGSTYTTLTNNEILLNVQNDQIGTQQTAATAGTIIPIPTSGYLLVFRSNKTAAGFFTPSTPVQLESIFNPADLATLPNLVGGGPLLVHKGQIVLDGQREQFSDAFVRETAARSAIGQTADGKILIVTAQNNRTGLGPSLSDMAEIMQQLGAVNALNLDGGSSTTLYLGGQILDRPPRSSARVHNGIGIFLQP